MGEKYESNFLAVFPFENIVDGQPATIKMKVEAEEEVLKFCVGTFKTEKRVANYFFRKDTFILFAEVLARNIISFSKIDLENIDH